MRLYDWLREILTWWHGQTLGTRIWTWRRGHLVGEDSLGNKYYRNADDSRRWVIFNGPVDASRIGAEWHGWLHHTFKEPPTERPFEIKEWEKEHIPNLTGTEGAFRPPGSVLTPAKREKARGDYEAWQPE
jgi:NADH:ubiquinone oxidoreductase subunit